MILKLSKDKERSNEKEEGQKDKKIKIDNFTRKTQKMR